MPSDNTSITPEHASRTPEPPENIRNHARPTHSDQRFRFRQWHKLIALTLLFLLLIHASLIYGSAAFSVSEIYQALFNHNTEHPAHAVLWNLRLPRTLLAILVGIHFALSGLILQTVIRNPLADPGIIGVSGGASLAVVSLLLLGDVMNAHLTTPMNTGATGLLNDEPILVSLSWMPFAALVGGLITAAVVLLLSWHKGGATGESLSPARLALNGVAISGILNAAVMWLVVAWGGGRTETTIIWLAGSLYGRDFSHLMMLLPWTLTGVLALCLIQHPLSLLRFNESLARSLGLNLVRWRLIAILVATSLAASAVAVAGPVGFVGLIIPHLARLIAGGQIRDQISVSLLAGGCLTLGADILSRTLLNPLELPAGALTTLLGIPLLLYLLYTRGWKTS